MAIRAGSQGLKYALPSQAEINARQSAAAASAGGSASATAFAANRRYALGRQQLQQSALQNALDRQFSAQQAGISRQFQAGQQTERLEQQEALQKLGQEFRAGQAELGRDFQAGQAKIGRGFGLSQDRFQTARDRNAGLQDAIRSGDMQLPKGSQPELDKLDQKRAKVLADKSLNPSQRADALAQIAEDRNRILSTAQPVSGASAANRNIDHFNPKTGQFQDNQEPGLTIPFDKRTGEPLKMPEQPDPSKTVPFRGREENVKEFTDFRNDRLKKRAEYDAFRAQETGEDGTISPSGYEALRRKYPNGPPEVPPTVYELRQQARQLGLGAGGAQQPGRQGLVGAGGAQPGQTGPQQQPRTRGSLRLHEAQTGGQPIKAASVEEAEQFLPPGTAYELPDGTLGQIPGGEPVESPGPLTPDIDRQFAPRDTSRSSPTRRGGPAPATQQPGVDRQYAPRDQGGAPPWQSLRKKSPSSSKQLGAFKSLYESGDEETRTAVTTIMGVLNKYGGPAQAGSLDEQQLIQAIESLQSKGIDVRKFMSEKK